MLAAMPNPLSEAKDISAALEALVRLNLTREEGIVLYRMWVWLSEPPLSRAGRGRMGT